MWLNYPETEPEKEGLYLCICEKENAEIGLTGGAYKVISRYVKVINFWRDAKAKKGYWNNCEPVVKYKKIRLPSKTRLVNFIYV